MQGMRKKITVVEICEKYFEKRVLDDNHFKVIAKERFILERHYPVPNEINSFKTTMCFNASCEVASN
jgi:hypothetical protein